MKDDEYEKKLENGKLKKKQVRSSAEVVSTVCVSVSCRATWSVCHVVCKCRGHMASPLVHP